jgi:predicted metal-dependent phosphotriesterase family hydrolase
MPTFDSVQWQTINGQNPLAIPVSRDGKLLPEVLEVLDVVAKHGLSLATGHSSPAESLMIIQEAKTRGIQRIIVTHPFISSIGMDIETQKKAAAMGAFLEYPFNATLPPFGPKANAPMAEHLKAIRAVGPENVIISSDLGQQGNPVHPDGLIIFIQALKDGGFTAEEIRTMTQTNPAKFLGLN